MMDTQVGQGGGDGAGFLPTLGMQGNANKIIEPGDDLAETTLRATIDPQYRGAYMIEFKRAMCPYFTENQKNDSAGNLYAFNMISRGIKGKAMEQFVDVQKVPRLPMQNNQKRFGLF
jgi:hypothetical protein